MVLYMAGAMIVLAAAVWAMAIALPIIVWIVNAILLVVSVCIAIVKE